MRPSTSQLGGRRRIARWLLLPALVAIVAAVAMPASASAAQCPIVPGVFATSWIGGSGSLHNDANWTNGTPSGACDVSITATGEYTVSMTGGANAKSLTLGGVGSTPHLVISDESPNTNFDAQPAGITIAAGASVTLTCQVGGCPGGGPDIYSGPSPFANAGTITVDANTGGGAVVGGQITNTGTIAFKQSGSLSGTVVNKNLISIADGATAFNSGSHCGDTGASVKNDTGGLIDGGATGLLSVKHFEQGAGTTKDVTLPCGSLKYSGSGASEVLATGGFSLSGELQEGQALTVSGESSNTNATLTENLTSKGSITLTCRQGSCGSVGFNVNDKDFVNAGIFTIAAAATEESGLGANFEGTIVNTGTLQFDQTGYLGGPVTNKGKLNIANGEQAKSNGSSCGDAGASVKNDTGGSINGTGTGFLRVVFYEQGAGTTSGTTPVRIPCGGALKYSGTGASTVVVDGGGIALTGGIAAGQTLRIPGSVSSGAFSNAGTIILDQTGSNPTLNNSGTVANTGTIETTGASANTSTVNGQIDQTGTAAQVVVPLGTKLQLNGGPLLLKAGTLSGDGTINGSVENIGGAVSPGASPGKMTLNGNYTQAAGGRLDIEIAGTVTEDFDALAISGNANLNGTVALIPVDGYQSSAAIGDSVSFLTYGGSLAGGFAATTVNPSLTCPKQLTVSSDTGAKALKATVSSTGSSCGAVTPPPPVVTPPLTPPTPKKTCPKGKKLQKGKCVPKKCPKGKKLKKGRCVKKKKPKARSRAFRQF